MLCGHALRSAGQIHTGEMAFNASRLVFCLLNGKMDFMAANDLCVYGKVNWLILLTSKLTHAHFRLANCVAYPELGF